MQGSPMFVQLVGMATAVLQDGDLDLHLTICLSSEPVRQEVEPLLVVLHLLRPPEGGQLDHVCDGGIGEVVSLTEGLKRCHDVMKLELQSLAHLVG